MTIHLFILEIVTTDQSGNCASALRCIQTNKKTSDPVSRILRILARLCSLNCCCAPSPKPIPYKSGAGSAAVPCGISASKSVTLWIARKAVSAIPIGPTIDKLEASYAKVRMMSAAVMVSPGAVCVGIAAGAVARQPGLPDCIRFRAFNGCRKSAFPCPRK